MKKFTKLFLAFVMAMGALSVFAAEHYVYYDGTLSNPSVWAWVSETVNCTASGNWPGDPMVKKDGKWYWELPAGKQLPLQIIISEGTEATKIGGGDLKYVDQATYHQDGTYTEFVDPTIPNVTATPASGATFKDGKSITVTLEVSMEATIYYTTDGTNPTKESAIYSEPLEFTETTTLKTLAVTTDGKEKADTYSARPGHSEHQTGLAVDVYNGNDDYNNFENTKEYKWMQKNAHKYGFILRYPKHKEKETTYQYESWHYRYVGEKIATYIKEHNISFEEYYVQFIEK